MLLNTLICVIGGALCIGLSPGPIMFPEPVLYIQLKPITAQMSKINWYITENSTIQNVANPNTSIGVVGDNDLSIRAGNIRILRFHFNISNSLQVQHRNSCVTIMKCQARLGNNYCNPDSDEPISSLNELVPGTYLKLLSCCDNLNIAQRSFTFIGNNCGLLERYPSCIDNSTTFQPTQSPATSQPTTSPVTSQPTTKSPTRSPATSQSQGPTTSPTQGPTTTTSQTPTTQGPTTSQTQAPTTNTTTTSSLYWLFFLLLLIPMAGVVGYYIKTRGQEEVPEPTPASTPAGPSTTAQAA
jgi:hypothetical protein